MRPRIILIVLPRERREVIEVYRDRLTAEQIESMLQAPEDEVIRIQLGHGKRSREYSSDCG